MSCAGRVGAVPLGALHPEPLQAVGAGPERRALPDRRPHRDRGDAGRRHRRGDGRRQPARPLPVHHLDPGDLRRVDLARLPVAARHEVGGHPPGGDLPDCLRAWCPPPSRRWSGPPAGRRSSPKRQPASVQVVSKATSADVAAGKAAAVGDSIASTREMAPVGNLLRSRGPHEPGGLEFAEGRIGPVQRRSLDRELVRRRLQPLEQAATARGPASSSRRCFPFVLLVAFSYVTRPVPKANLNRFFARVHTPVQPTPETDAAAVEDLVRQPRQVRLETSCSPARVQGDHEAGDQRVSRVLRDLRPRRRDPGAAVGDGDRPMNRAPARGRNRVGINNCGLFPLNLSPLDTLRWAVAHGAEGVAFLGLQPEHRADLRRPGDRGAEGLCRRARDLPRMGRRPARATRPRDLGSEGHPRTEPRRGRAGGGARHARCPVVLGRPDAVARRAPSTETLLRETAGALRAAGGDVARSTSRWPSRRISSSRRSSCCGCSRCAGRRPAGGWDLPRHDEPADDAGRASGGDAETAAVGGQHAHQGRCRPLGADGFTPSRGRSGA